MKDMLTGAGITAFYFALVVLLDAIHPLAPYIAFILVSVFWFHRLIKASAEMIKRGEAPFNGFQF